MKILLLAGEESGELYARTLRRLLTGDEIRGFGDYGFKIADLAVIGFLAVLGRMFYFLRVKRTMERAIDEWKPDVVCTIDYPGMNLPLAAFAKRRGIRTVHVVCPQVWAWKSWRIPKIQANLDKLCCFFPFEPKLFRPGFAEFVGHPLVNEFARLKAVEKGGGQTKLLAMLPGSRMGEIERILPTMLDAAERIEGVEVVIPAASDRAYDEIVRQLSSPLRECVRGRVKVLHGGARELLLRADCAVVASGTATLEAALARCPTLLVYRVGRLFAWLLRRMIKGIRHVGLANIIAEKCGGECPMPELLQEDFTVEAVVAQLKRWLEDEGERRRTIEVLEATMRRLTCDGDAMMRVAKVVGNG